MMILLVMAKQVAACQWKGLDLPSIHSWHKKIMESLYYVRDFT